MIAKDENLLVKMIKKAVGLPTGNSNCCASEPVSAGDECCDAEVPGNSTAGCGCAATLQGAGEDRQPAVREGNAEKTS